MFPFSGTPSVQNFFAPSVPTAVSLGHYSSNPSDIDAIIHSVIGPYLNLNNQDLNKVLGTKV